MPDQSPPTPDSKEPIPSPKSTPSRPLSHGGDHDLSQQLLAVSLGKTEDILQSLGTRAEGLTESEALERLEKFGPNSLEIAEQFVRLKQFGHAILNPLVLLLLALGTVSFLTGDANAGAIMSLMVALGVGLRFVQEARAATAAARLKAMIHVTATVLREGKAREIPFDEVVPGDLVLLTAGDMVPADLRLIASKDLFAAQSALTGESFPVEKFDRPMTGEPRSLLQAENICFLGTNVTSGTGTGVAIATGLRTYLGSVARIVAGTGNPTAFDRGVRRFTWLMIAYMAVMVPAVFLINGLVKHNWHEAFFFAIAVAVGLTPEMLPMIVSVCLSRGAMLMSKKKVIVKRLNSIQNFGAMDILCTDKTGTLTLDRVVLQRHCDVAGSDDQEVLAEAFLNSHFQTGLRSVLDRAILEHEEVPSQIQLGQFKKIDEIPFDFSRKVMSVVVESPQGETRLLCKGAPEAVYERCDRFELDGEIYPMDPLLLVNLKEEYQNLSNDGFRVLAVAYKKLDSKPAYSKEDEVAMILRGYLAYLDPPKDSARQAIDALRGHGVAVKVLTGDNEWVSRKICREVGLVEERTLLGPEIEKMGDDELQRSVEEASLFARLSPMDKQRIVAAFQKNGRVVGFIGDGINDAPALRAADVGISVDTAVDVAKESADLIMLEKNLMILEEGVIEGRKVFANILKYIRMGASSNFGNMFSVLGASVFLPFLPMAPLQILANNLLYDFSQVPIPTDNVDPELVTQPQPWSMQRISRFIMFVGPISSIFDYATYFIMLHVFNCWAPARASLFQTGWFVESLLSQTLIIHIIRTNRMPFVASKASWPLAITSVTISCIGVALPFSFLAGGLGLVPLPHAYWPLLLLVLFGYGLLAFGLKSWFTRRGWI